LPLKQNSLQLYLLFLRFLHSNQCLPSTISIVGEVAVEILDFVLLFEAKTSFIFFFWMYQRYVFLSSSNRAIHVGFRRFNSTAIETGS
jgi:hypothetical protein